MFYVYILENQINGKIYTGFTSNLKQRLQQHLQGHVHTTSRMDKLKLIFYEAFIDKRDAVERENYLKTTQGKRTMKLMLKFGRGAFV